ncbi:MAG TPA: alpha/beta fold hydrolase, partial [Phycisphaerae bacterium]|nr:alpha/beta fold hydrolase [Phycisphaerae bacterium]
PAKENEKLPWLIFFQGGPGFGSPRPGESSGWIKRAIQDYRVLLLDDRGTGRSTPVTFQTLAGKSPREMADYLKHFRQDSIVRDAELIRRELFGKNEKWTLLGQSYGGWCIFSYLSIAPEGVKEAIVTGGVPSVTRPAEDIYRASYPRVREKNRQYFERFPADQERAQEIAAYLAANKVKLPAGGDLTVRRFQQLGMELGMSDGAAKVHYMLEEAFVDAGGKRTIGHNFLRAFENSQSFDTNPIFAILHEAIYGQGAATRWAAQRVKAEFPEFEYAGGAAGKEFLFTGEMIYPWMFEDYACLKPLKEAAELLAEFGEWPKLYDVDVLKRNTVPVVGATYYNDMYVDREQSEETARLVPGVRLWVTSEYEHNALRADGEKVLGRLLGMLHGEI